MSSYGGKTLWSLLRNREREQPQGPALPHLAMYPKNPRTLVQKKIFTPSFLAALFSTAKTWKRPKGPAVEEWVRKDVGHLHTKILQVPIEKPYTAYFPLTLPFLSILSMYKLLQQLGFPKPRPCFSPSQPCLASKSSQSALESTSQCPQILATWQPNRTLCGGWEFGIREMAEPRVDFLSFLSCLK